ncbi:immunity protein YezG family protein [Enterococcus faecalis]|uniref:immunity protein YezG family protein n=3 Tax=Enterococcus TaxID=1350 RepID=UPI000814D00F|nr:immunity protein YezG family protein [Enterococcus faecalis]BAV37305.1 hypothetical protein EFW11_2066 [Enterococcus faecalis]
MTKIFEDKITDLQVDMVDSAFQYIEGRADKIYLYASIEEGVLSFNVFYQINNKIVFMSKVNDALENNEKKYDVSDDEQLATLDAGLECLQKLERVFEEYDKPVPTQFKLVYDIKSEHLKMEYKYDLQYSNTDDLHSSDIFMAWYEEVKKEVENPPLEFGF